MRRIKFFSFPLIVVAFFMVVFLWLSCANKEPQATVLPAALGTPATELLSLKDKKVLIVYGGWPGHQPAAYAEKISGLLRKEGAVVTLSDTSGVYADETVMSEVDLIIQSITMDHIGEEAFNGLQRAVKNGAGFAGSHGGFCDAFRNHTAYQYMTGAQFVAHPGGQLTYTVNITNPDDPITEGIKDFTTKTEQYYLHVDPNIKVLATTTFSGEHDDWIEGAVMPVVWKKYHGKGRIFCITLGHDPAEFDEEIPRRLLMNGFRWAAGSKYQEQEKWLSPVYPRS